MDYSGVKDRKINLEILKLRHTYPSYLTASHSSSLLPCCMNIVLFLLQPCQALLNLKALHILCPLWTLLPPPCFYMAAYFLSLVESSKFSFCSTYCMCGHIHTVVFFIVLKCLDWRILSIFFLIYCMSEPIRAKFVQSSNLSCPLSVFQCIDQYLLGVRTH